ncbi:MAG: diguanylate cyclase, partial [Epsilonproteobacteria bacterium]|nr:diguanylate cyclase [Campylobacterota bacterium]
MQNKEIRYELRYGRVHPLTQLPDRRRFINTLANSTANKLALLNVNGFWNFNHSFGYTVGDQILKTISQRIQKRFAHAGVFHLGGDEFAILAGKEIEKEQFIQTIESCLWYFGYSPINVENEKIYAPLRIGVAIGYDDLFLHAEFAIKQAKRIGKDQTTVSREVKRHITIKKTAVVKTDKTGNPINEPCQLLLKAPFVCNPCKRVHTICPFDKSVYYAAHGQKTYEAVLTSAREGIP